MNGKSAKERKTLTTLEYREGRHIVYLVPRRPSLVGVLDVTTFFVYLWEKFFGPEH